MTSPAPPISNRQAHLAVRRRAEPGRHPAPGRRRAGGRVGLGRGRQGRWTVAHPSGTSVAQSSSGETEIVCMQSTLLDPHNPKFFATASIYQDVPGLQLAKCTYASMRTDARHKPCLAWALKLSGKNQLARSLALPGRDESDRDAAGEAENRSKIGRNGPVSEDFCQVSGRFFGSTTRRAARPGAVCCLRHRDAAVSKSRRAINPPGSWA